MTYLTNIFNFLIGTCIGSHALVITQRWNTANFITGTSHCDTCQINLNILDEIPIYSYIKNKGHCKFCHTPIPYVTLLAEILSGFAYISIDFFNISSIFKIIFLFFFLIICLQDYQQQEFYTIFLFPMLLIALASPNSAYHQFIFTDWIVLSTFCLVFFIQIRLKKMGSGDVIIYLLIALYNGTTSATYILLGACLLFIIYCVSFSRLSQPLPFIPFIYCSFIINNF